MIECQYISNLFDLDTFYQRPRGYNHYENVLISNFHKFGCGGGPSNISFYQIPNSIFFWISRFSLDLLRNFLWCVTNLPIFDLDYNTHCRSATSDTGRPSFSKVPYHSSLCAFVYFGVGHTGLLSRGSWYLSHRIECGLTVVLFDIK